MALVNLRNVTLAFGQAPLLDGIDLQIHPREKIGLLGRNGSGKSSFMKLLHGMIEPDSGNVIRENHLRTALLPQDIPTGITGSIIDVIARDEIHPGIGAIIHVDEKKRRQGIDHVISLMSLDPELLFQNLSAGMKRRVILGNALAHDPDILLLDEPTNHLDMEAITWLEEFLARYEKTVIFVTHDRMFLQNIARRIIELDRGKLFDWDCGYLTFLERKQALLDNEETENARFDKKLAEEEVWVRKGIKARRTRNEGRVRALEDMRRERAKRRDLTGTASLAVNEAERSGKIVAEADSISFSYTDRAIINDLSVTVMRGDRIGIMGPNGCGKSTLVKLLLSELAPSTGTVKLGTKIEVAYFDQLRGTLDDRLTLRETVAVDGEYIDINGKKKHVIGYLQEFLFPPDRCSVKVGVLSGGEKNRLMLALLLMKPVNLLVLDEPTNDLDMETAELLEELLMEFQGTIILVSHDRAFLNSVVTSTLVFEDGGHVGEYAGGYDDWLYQRKKPVTPSQKSGKPAKTKPAGNKKKLTQKEEQELASLPAEIDSMEKEKAALYEKMADPSLYREKPGEVTVMKSGIDSLDEKIHEKFSRWQELEAEKELLEKNQGDR